MDIQIVSVAIRDAVAPVFLLTGIGSILNVLVGRLGRAIDRARMMQDQINADKTVEKRAEINLIVRRIRWLRLAIGFATIGAFSISVSIVTLFLAVERGIDFAYIVLWSFMGCMLSIIVALLCFLIEILLTSKDVIITAKND